MLLLHLKIAARNLLKHKGYSLINIAGLSLGMICVIFILFYVRDELSYDRFHKHADNIYRITGHGRLNDSDFNFATSGAPVAGVLLADYPEVEAVVRFRDQGSFLMNWEDKHFKEERVIFADSNLFEVFSFDWIQGDPKKALTEPNSLVMSSELAHKYFGEVNPIGQLLKLDNQEDVKVTGVFAPIPHNSHFHYDFFISMASLEDSRTGEWTSFNYLTYLLLNEQADPEALKAKFPAMVEKYMGPEIQQYMGVSLAEFEEQGNHLGLSLQALTDIHLHSDLEDEHEGNSDIKYIFLFSIIGIFILLIACINFMNLTTARSASRALEVGIKKVVGATRIQLVVQFLAESLLLSTFAVLLAAVLIPALLPMFNELAGKSLEFSLFRESFVLLLLTGIAIGVGVLAGSYPAFYLSAFKPISVLKGKQASGIKSGWLRSSLVVFQFATTVFLIVGTIVVFSQMQYVQHKKLGFNKEQVLVLHDAYAMGDKVAAFKTEMLQDPRIASATVSGFLPVPSNNNSSSYWSGKAPNSSNSHIISNWRVDYDYVQTMGMEIIEGRDFSREFRTDSMAVLVNEALVAKFGWEEAIGAELSNFGNSENDVYTYHVIGVLNNFHYTSLRHHIAPLMMCLAPSRSMISFRLQTEEVDAVISSMESQWNLYSGGQPFAYSFLDDRFNNIYLTEQRFGKIFAVFAGLSIFIACLGLLGLAAYTAEQRTKEIGIRKILGANVWHIITLLSREYALLLAIAFVLGGAISFWVMHQWLIDFEYRTSLGIGTFVWAAIATFAIATLSVSYQSIKAALADPVDSLRHE